MVSSQLPDVASAGARQACLAALELPEAADLADFCLSGSEAQRIGAAQVMAANVATAAFPLILRRCTNQAVSAIQVSMSVLKPRNAFPDLRERNLKNTNI